MLIPRGDYNAYEQEIVEKYSPFYSGDIDIWFISEFTLPNCGVTDTHYRATGCTYWNGNIPYRIELLNDWNWRMFTENSLAHELGHYFFRNKDEDFATRYALMMTSWVNSLR